MAKTKKNRTDLAAERYSIPADGAHAPETQTQALPPATYAAAYSTAAEPQSDFVAAASSVPFGGLMQVLDRHMNAIKLVYPKEYELVMRKIVSLSE